MLKFYRSYEKKACHQKQLFFVVVVVVKVLRLHGICIPYEQVTIEERTDIFTKGLVT